MPLWIRSEVFTFGVLKHDLLELGQVEVAKLVDKFTSGLGLVSDLSIVDNNKPVLVKADSASEAEEAWGAAAALMELFSRGLVDDPKKPAAKSGASHSRI